MARSRSAGTRRRSTRVRSSADSTRHISPIRSRSRSRRARQTRTSPAGRAGSLVTALYPEPPSVRIHDRAQHDAALVGPVVAGAAVHRRALVPHQHIADAPAVVVDETLLGGVFAELLDQRPGLLPLHADESMRVHGIDEEDRPSGYRMPRDRRPLRFAVLLLGHALVVAIQTLAGGTRAAAVQAGEAGQQL